MKQVGLSILLSIAASLAGTFLLRALLSATAGPPQQPDGRPRPSVDNVNTVVVVIPIAIGGNIAGGGNTWKGLRRGRRGPRGLFGR